MKKILILVIGISFFLTGCLGTSDSSNNDGPKTSGFHSYSTEDFKIQIPDEWDVLTPLNFTAGTPPNTLVAFRSNIRNPRFTPNVVIIRNELSAEISTSDYAKTLHQKISNELSAFQEISVEKTNITVGGKPAETLFIYIEGRESPDSDLKRFMAIAGVKNQTAFIAMGSFLTNIAETESVANKMAETIRSFEIK